MEALAVASGPQDEAWTPKHRRPSDAALAAEKAKKWQQLIVHAMDERGDGIADDFLEAGVVVEKRFRRLEAFDLDVHAFEMTRASGAFT